MQEIIEGAEDWTADLSGNVVRWGPSVLLIVVLLGLMTSIVPCEFGRLGGRDRASRSRSGWNKVTSVLGKSRISNVSALFKDAGIGAKMDKKRQRSDNEPDVGDACAVI